MVCNDDDDPSWKLRVDGITVNGQLFTGQGKYDI